MAIAFRWMVTLVFVYFFCFFCFFFFCCLLWAMTFRFRKKRSEYETFENDPETFLRRLSFAEVNCIWSCILVGQIPMIWMCVKKRDGVFVRANQQTEGFRLNHLPVSRIEHYFIIPGIFDICRRWTGNVRARDRASKQPNAREEWISSFFSLAVPVAGWMRKEISSSTTKSNP